MRNFPLRWKDCIATATNTLNFAVGYAYVREHFDEETKLMVGMNYMPTYIGNEYDAEYT